MKIKVMTVVLLIAIASMGAHAQSAGNAAGKQAASTAGRTNSAGQSGSSAAPNAAAGSSKSSAGSGSTGKLSDGKASGQESPKPENKAGKKSVNQQAAGVPNKGSAAKLRTGQTSNNQ